MPSSRSQWKQTRCSVSLFLLRSCSSVAPDFFPWLRVEPCQQPVRVSRSPRQALPWAGRRVCKGSARWPASSRPVPSLGALLPFPLSRTAGWASAGSPGFSSPAPREGRETSCSPHAVRLAGEKPGHWQRLKARAVKALEGFFFHFARLKDLKTFHFFLYF